MSKSKRALAYELPSLPNIEQRYATVSIRPLRTAFLIEKDIPLENFRDLITYNTGIWGGKFNLLIPYSDSRLTHWNRQNLRMASPDVIAVFGENDGFEFILGLISEDEPFFLQNWDRDDPKTLLEHYPDPLGNLSLRFLLQHKWTKIRPTNSTNLRIPSISSDANINGTMCLAVQFGLPDQQLDAIYRTNFLAEGRAILTNVKHYLDMSLGLFGSDYIAPIDMTTSKLTLIHGEGLLFPEFWLVLASANSIEDYCVYWNYRISKAGSITIMPYEYLSTEESVQTLAEWLKANVTPIRFNLVSATIGKESLIDLRNRLKGQLSGVYSCINIQYEGFYIPQTRYYENQLSHELTLRENTFSLRSSQPSFAEYLRSPNDGKWIIDIDFQAKTAFIPPHHSGRANLLALTNPPAPILGSSRLRVSHHAYLSFKTNQLDEFIRIRIPNEATVFESFFQSFGYETQITELQRYTMGLLKLLGGHTEVGFLQDPQARTLVDAMKNGEGFSIDRMKQNIRFDKNSHQSYAEFITTYINLVAELARKNILLRGYSIHCPVCDLTAWYPVQEISEVLVCAGCISKIQAPIETGFSFRLNELAARAFQQGVLPILLTVPILDSISEKSFSFLPSISLTKSEEKIEIDLVASCDGVPVLVECKDLRKGVLSHNGINEVCDQFDRVLDVAVDTGARLVILSVLASDVPDEIREHIKKKTEQFHDQFSIWLLTEETLNRGYISKLNSPAKISDILAHAEIYVNGWLEDKDCKMRLENL